MDPVKLFTTNLSNFDNDLLLRGSGKLGIKGRLPPSSVGSSGGARSVCVRFYLYVKGKHGWDRVDGLAGWLAGLVRIHGHPSRSTLYVYSMPFGAATQRRLICHSVVIF